RRAGFDNVMCTPESASDTTLASLQKGFKREHVVRAAKHLAAAGLHTFWFFLLGAPGETLETVRETLDFCERHVPPTDMVLFTTGIRVHPGTPLELTLKESGWFSQDDPLFEPSWYLSPELDLETLYRTLVRAAEAHPNWMTNAETVMSPRLASLVKRGLHAVGLRRPFWTRLPQLFDVTTKLGVRRLDLARNEKRVVGDGEVRHRRPLS
ncbi:MAG TPA: radical SAM protein, partial [Minicystis sp.]|nr:radical SAM protein [Minicystis sp.]